jgi:uncharacterized protein
MKQILLGFSAIAFSFILFQCSPQTPTSRIFNDYDSVLTKAQMEMLDSLYESHEKKTSNEIALLITDDYGMDSTLSNFSLHFFNQHGIGKRKLNNGVLVVVSPQRKQTRITTGWGTEKVLKDQDCQFIVDSIMIPEFKKQNYFEGIWKASKYIIEFLERPENKIK